MRLDLEENLTPASPEVVVAEMYSAPMQKAVVDVRPAGFWGWWRKPIVPPPDPMIVKSALTSNEIRNLIEGIAGRPKYSWRFPDDEVYYVAKETDKPIVQQVLVKSGISKLVFVPDKRDCDKYTKMGQADLKKDDRTVHVSTFDFHGIFPRNGKQYCHSVMGLPLIVGGKLSFIWRENQTDTFFNWPRHWRLRLYRG